MGKNRRSAAGPTREERLEHGWQLRASPGAAAGTYDVMFNAGTFPGTIVGSDPATVIVSGTARAASHEPSAEPLTVASQFFTTTTATHGAALLAWPNPARDRATIGFTLDAPADVRLVIFDALGREIAVLVDGRLEAGMHEAPFVTGTMPSGIYLVHLATGGEVRTHRVTLVQ